MPAWIWLILSTILLTIPGSSFPRNDWMSRLWLDKWIHIGLFAILVSLFCWAITGSKKSPEQLKKGFIMTAGLGLVYGTAMEFVQKYFVANRSFDTWDILADAGGCFAGWLYCQWRYIKK